MKFKFDNALHSIIVICLVISQCHALFTKKEKLDLVKKIGEAARFNQAEGVTVPEKRSLSSNEDWMMNPREATLKFGKFLNLKS